MDTYPILSWNIQEGLKDDRGERKSMVNFLRRYPVFMLQDTGVSTLEQRTAAEASFPGHTLYWPRRGSKGSYRICTGVKVAMCSSKKFFLNNDGHVLVVKVFMDGLEMPPTYMTNVYCLSKQSVPGVFPWLSKLFRFVLTTEQILLAGDLNAWFGNIGGVGGGVRPTDHEKVNRKGREWCGLMNIFYMNLLTGNLGEKAEVTFARGRGTEVDFAAARLYNNQVIGARVNHRGGSDHFAVELTWNPSPPGTHPATSCAPLLDNPDDYVYVLP